MKHGNKRYEGTNHLGNFNGCCFFEEKLTAMNPDYKFFQVSGVLVVYSDKRLIGKCDADTVTFYKADLIAATDYSPFGAPIKQFYANDDTSGYLFGHQGQFKDNEINGAGNTYFYTFRVNDTRLGRFFSIDPLEADYPWNSPYAYSENRLLDGTELEGAEYSDIIGKIADAYTTVIKVYKAYQVVKKTLTLVTESVNEINKYEVRVMGNVHLRWSIGSRVSFEVKKVFGGDIDLGSVSLLEFEGSVDLKTGDATGDFYYLNKNKETVFTQKFSGAIPFEQIGVPISVNGEYSNKEVKSSIDGEIKAKENKIMSGVAIGLLGVSGVKTETNNENSIGVETGVGGALGLISVVEASMTVTVDLVKKK